MSAYVKEYNELLLALKSADITQRAYAEKLGISVVSLYHRLCGKYPFTQYEIATTKELLGLSPEQVDKIFFAHRFNCG